MYLIMQHDIHAKLLHSAHLSILNSESQTKRFNFRTERQMNCQNSSKKFEVSTQTKEHLRTKGHNMKTLREKGEGKKQYEQTKSQCQITEVKRAQGQTLKQNTLFISNVETDAGAEKNPIFMETNSRVEKELEVSKSKEEATWHLSRRKFQEK